MSMWEDRLRDRRGPYGGERAGLEESRVGGVAEGAVAISAR